ncbi:MAG: DNA topoisomerase 3 [Lachnospiraceae bacterium]
MKLVLAEKTSVAQGIAGVLGAGMRKNGYLEGNGYLVSWCVGHLVELAGPEAYGEQYRKWSYEDLPILPGQWQYQVSERTRKQFLVVKQLMDRGDVESLICATDAGREGELIFRLVYHQCHCRKPFERLWISSMEEDAIREGFSHLKPGSHYDLLYEAALCRERADWMVGINATRLFSVRYRQTLNVGRVMTPTLALVVDREAAIDAFQPEPFFKVRLTLCHPEDAAVSFSAESERMAQKEQAKVWKADCEGQEAEVIRVEQKEKTEHPPALYDLTSLQRDANRRLGFTARQTLDYAQSLYEKRLLTYPRTDSRYLTEDMEKKLPVLTRQAAEAFGWMEAFEASIPFGMRSGQVVNSGKVQDHPAILPTGRLPEVDLATLPAGEKALLALVAGRLLRAVGEPCRYLETVLEVSCGGHVFTAKGKTVLQEGWRQMEQNPDSAWEREAAGEKEGPLPLLSQGAVLPVQQAAVQEGKTRPPKHFTEDTLLAAMESAGAGEPAEKVERKGLGTPATRAGILEKLIRIGFLERRKEKKRTVLIPTEKGNALIRVVPEQIRSAAMTAQWEEKLLRVEQGTYEGETFLKEIRDMVTTLVKAEKGVPDARMQLSSDRKAAGRCPRCGKEVLDGRKSYFCSDRDCRFVLWKENRFFASLGKTLSASMAETLLKEGKIRLKGCRSAKTGKTFDAVVLLHTETDGRVQFQLEFEKGGTNA